MYNIYSSKHPGHSFDFEFSRDGAFSRETLSFEGGTLYIYIKKTSKYFQLVSLIKQ